MPPSSWPWRLLLILSALAGLLDAAQYLVFPCNMRGWFTPVVGFVFFFSSLLFIAFVRDETRRKLSLIPLAVAVISAFPWFITHACP